MNVTSVVTSHAREGTLSSIKLRCTRTMSPNPRPPHNQTVTAIAKLLYYNLQSFSICYEHEHRNLLWPEKKLLCQDMNVLKQLNFYYKLISIEYTIYTFLDVMN